MSIVRLACPRISRPTKDGRTLVIAGPWSDDAGEVVSSGAVDALHLNYALGFEGFDIDFLEAWPNRCLKLLDRGVQDLSRITRLASTLESLSLQAAPGATIDLTDLPHLRRVHGDWAVIDDSISNATLSEIITWRFTATGLRDFRDLPQARSPGDQGRAVPALNRRRRRPRQSRSPQDFERGPA